MPEPYQYLPESTYSIARRCSERRRFLRPDGFIAQLFLYLNAWAAQHYNIDIVAVEAGAARVSQPELTRCASFSAFAAIHLQRSQTH